MTVQELIEELKKYDPNLPCCFALHSEHVILEAADLEIRELQPARADNWIHSARPDKPKIKYLAFPGN